MSKLPIAHENARIPAIRYLRLGFGLRFRVRVRVRVRIRVRVRVRLRVRFQPSSTSKPGM